MLFSQIKCAHHQIDGLFKALDVDDNGRISAHEIIADPKAALANTAANAAMASQGTHNLMVKASTGPGSMKVKKREAKQSAAAK